MWTIRMQRQSSSPIIETPGRTYSLDDSDEE